MAYKHCVFTNTCKHLGLPKWLCDVMETMNALGSAVSPGIMGKVWSSSSIWAQYWKQKLCFDFNTETNFPSRLAAASEITMLCDKIFRNRHKPPRWFLSSNQLVFSVSCSFYFTTFQMEILFFFYSTAMTLHIFAHKTYEILCFVMK